MASANKGKAFVSALKIILSSPLFTLFTAALLLANYYLGFDTIAICVYAVFIWLMLLLLKDQTPTICQFLFICIIASNKNSPITSAGGYYTQLIHLVPIMAVGSIAVLCAVYRIVQSIGYGGLKHKFNFLSVTVILFAVALALNGVLSDEFVTKNIYYGVGVCVLIIFLYFLCISSVSCTEKNIKQVCFSFMIFGLSLIVMEALSYWSNFDGIDFNNLFSYRNDMFTFGWGTWNALGLYLVCCIPPTLYLAKKSKAGGLYFLVSIIFMAGVLGSMSLKAYIGLLIAFPFCYIAALFTAKNKVFAWLTTVFAVAVIAAIITQFFSEIMEALKGALTTDIFYGEEMAGDGLSKFYQIALDYIKKYPIFGAGFYAKDITYAYSSEAGILPKFYHDTFLTLAGACGCVGLGVYLLHRVTSVVCFFKKVTFEKFFFGMALLAFLVLGLLDDDFFNVFPIFIYVILLVFATYKAEKKVEVKKEEPKKEYQQVSTIGRPKKRPQTYVYMDGYKRGTDEFMDTLTIYERSEFTALFLTGQDVRYVIGGDNKDFFTDLTIKLGMLYETCSQQLIDKIFAYTQRMPGEPLSEPYVTEQEPQEPEKEQKGKKDKKDKKERKK